MKFEGCMTRQRSPPLRPGQVDGALQLTQLRPCAAHACAQRTRHEADADELGGPLLHVHRDLQEQRAHNEARQHHLRHIKRQTEESSMRAGAGAPGVEPEHRHGSSQLRAQVVPAQAHELPKRQHTPNGEHQPTKQAKPRLRQAALQELRVAPQQLELAAGAQQEEGPPAGHVLGMEQRLHAWEGSSSLCARHCAAAARRFGGRRLHFGPAPARSAGQLHPGHNLLPASNMAA